ncbi:MAG: hypothetical protein A2V79_12250 [Betaproteobacteria bacterium RBG_16_56_24]|nr:MAG: hypothetical protein A2V79_12250 [Betaproteobacteria bacterium RBG_16_56_24]
MLNSFPVRLLWQSFNWLARFIIAVSSIAAAMIAIAIIMLRYWILPDIGQYHDRIAGSLAGAIGSPVTIGKIECDWTGLQPRLDFTDVRILDEQRQPVLVLPRIDTSVSWMSLFAAELRLASLEIDSPELLIRRDVTGGFFVGGMSLSRHGGDGNLSDWLLHQSSIVVRNALIVWVDEQRNAPPLVLQQVNLRVDNLFSRHNFAFHAIPPDELSAPLDVRGDFHGESFDNLGGWRGQIYARLDYTDVAAWRPWVDLPAQFSSGRGALRGWLGVEGGRMIGVTADMELHDVATRLGEDVPEMKVLNLRGRAAWHEISGGFEVSSRQLAMRLQNGFEFQPMDFYFLTAKASDRQPARGVVRVNLLQLGGLAGLAKFLPLEAGLRARLEAYAPKGKVSNLNAQWQGAPEKPDSYKLKGHFENLAVNQAGKMPGFSGLTVDVDGNEESGKLSINSRRLVVDAPGVMREPLFFATLTGQAGWRRKGGELSIDVDNVAVVNDDLAGNLSGSYQTQAGTLGVLDLTGRLTRGDVRRAARYTPLVALDKAGNDWLNDALLAGHTEDFRIRIKGNLSDFPVDGTKDTLFKIGGHAQDVILEFDKEWPRIEKISGEFSIRGNKLEVNSPAAMMAGARLQNVIVTLPDMMSKDLSLEIKGDATASNNEFLQFIQQSPVRGYIDGFTDGMRAGGNGHLELSLHIPLSGQNDVQAEAGMGDADVAQGGTNRKQVHVSGIFRVQDSDIDLGGGVPVLRKTRGSLYFTESGMKASDVRAEVLGGTASIDIQSGEGGLMHASVRGHSNLDEMRKSAPHPLLDYLHGDAAWDADIRVVKKSAQVVINSDLKGISSDLPQPFAKRADEAMTLRVEKSHVTGGKDVITAEYGKLLSMRLARREENGEMAVKRGAINFYSQDTFGDKIKWPARDGVWIAGTLPILAVQGWEGLTGQPKDAGQAAGYDPALQIAGASLLIEELTGFGQSIKGVRVNVTRRGERLAARLSGSMLSGEIAWLPHGYENGGKVNVHLKNLQWMNGGQTVPPASQSRPGKPVSPGNLPAMEITIDDLQLKGRQIGRFELVGYPDGQDWRMRRLRITNPDGALMGDGIWHGSAQSEVNLMLDISDAGKILERSSYPDTVKGGSGRLAANLSWIGSPDEFNYATLSGTLKLDAGKGRFLKMDPGAGKLLSILSLQSLPKRITLDFTDVFSEGFQFDNISGNAQVKNGVIDTQDFHIDGSSAKVTMKGSVDLNDETQNLRVRVLPTIGSSVSLIGAFAAGPAVGVGALILNKVLGDPLDKLVSFEYNVSGTWTDPNVVKVERAPVTPTENN